MSDLIKNIFGKDTGIRHTASSNDVNSGPKYCGICQEAFQKTKDDFRINDCVRCVEAGYVKEPAHWRKVFAQQRANTLSPDMQALAEKLEANKVKKNAILDGKHGVTRAASDLTWTRSAHEIQANKKEASLETVKDQVLELLPSIVAEMGLTDTVDINLVADMIVPTKINAPIRHNANARSAVRSIVLEALSHLGTADNLLKKEAKVKSKGVAKTASAGDYMLQEGMHRVSSEIGTHVREIGQIQHTAYTKEVGIHDEQPVEVAPTVQVPDNTTNGLSTNTSAEIASQFHQTPVLSGGIIPYTEGANFNSIPSISDINEAGIKRIRTSAAPKIRTTKVASQVVAPKYSEYFKFAGKLSPSLPVENLTGQLKKEARAVLDQHTPVGTVTAAYSDQSEKSWKYYLTDKGALFLSPDSEFHAITPRAFLDFVQTDPTFQKWAALPPNLEEEDDKGPMDTVLPTAPAKQEVDDNSPEDDSGDEGHADAPNEDNAIGEQAENTPDGQDMQDPIQPQEGGANDPGGAIDPNWEPDISHLLGPDGDDSHLPIMENFENPDHEDFDPAHARQESGTGDEMNGMPPPLGDDANNAPEGKDAPLNGPPMADDADNTDPLGKDTDNAPDNNGQSQRSQGDDDNDEDDKDNKDTEEEKAEKREAKLVASALEFLPHIEASFPEHTTEAQFDLAIATALEYLETKMQKVAANGRSREYDPVVDAELAKGKGAGAHYARIRINKHHELQGLPPPYPEAAKAQVGGRPTRNYNQRVIDTPEGAQTEVPQAEDADAQVAKHMDIVNRTRNSPKLPGEDQSKADQRAYFDLFNQEMGYPHPYAPTAPMQGATDMAPPAGVDGPPEMEAPVAPVAPEAVQTTRSKNAPYRDRLMQDLKDKISAPKLDVEGPNSYAEDQGMLGDLQEQVRAPKPIKPRLVPAAFTPVDELIMLTADMNDDEFEIMAEAFLEIGFAENDILATAKNRFTEKEHRQHEHIMRSEEDNGMSKDEADEVAWKTVNKQKSAKAAKKDDDDDLTEEEKKINSDDPELTGGGKYRKAGTDELMDALVAAITETETLKREAGPTVNFNAGAQIGLAPSMNPNRRTNRPGENNDFAQPMYEDEQGAFSNDMAPAAPAPKPSRNFNEMYPSLAQEPETAPAPQQSPGFAGSPVADFGKTVRDYFSNAPGKHDAPGGQGKLDSFVNWIKGLHEKLKAPAQQAPALAPQTTMQGQSIPTDPSVPGWPKGTGQWAVNPHPENPDIEVGQPGIVKSPYGQPTGHMNDLYPPYHLPHSASEAQDILSLTYQALEEDGDFGHVAEALNELGYSPGTIVHCAQLVVAEDQHKNHKKPECPSCHAKGSMGYLHGRGGYFGCGACGFGYGYGGGYGDNDAGAEDNDADDGGSGDSDGDSDGGGDAD